MRHWMTMAAGLVVLALARPAQAQMSGWSWFGSSGVQQIQNVPITPEEANSPIAMPIMRDLSFNLRSLLPRFALPNNKPVFGQSVFPTHAQMPGKEYLKAFGYRKARPVE